MPEEIDLTEEEEDDLDKVCDEDEDDWDDGCNDSLSSFHILLSLDSHGREHRGKGPGGGQFVKKGEEDNVAAQEEKPTPTEPSDEPPGIVERIRRVSAEEHKRVIAKAIEKYRLAPLPTEREIEAARVGVEKKGANMFRKDLIGNTKNRRARRNALLEEFGDGETAPCVYCGKIITHGGALEQDKIYTTLEGGRYRMPNLIPACSKCNKDRGDMPFIEAIKKVVKFVKQRAEESEPK